MTTLPPLLLEHPGLSADQTEQLRGMVANGITQPVQPVVIKAFMQEMAAFFARKVGPRKPNTSTPVESDYHYDHVYRWSNGKLTNSIEWVPRQDLMAAAWAAERNRLSEPY